MKSYAKILIMKIKVFDELSEIYEKHGHSLYIVGGTSRDLLLHRPFTDLDFVSDATPEEEKAFLPEANYVFAKYGSIRLKRDGLEVDITTLREESDYIDHRHPLKIIFVRDLETDSLRRDFTINAIYLDKAYQIFDFHQGKADLEKRIIRFIGDPDKRIQEDPLRICRAERFARLLDFKLDAKTEEAIQRNRYLLKEIKPAKLDEEERKGWNRK